LTPSREETRTTSPTAQDPARLPIVVAVTGHHDLLPEQMPALTEAVRGVLRRLSGRYPTTTLVLLTSLAAGAERMAARVAVEEKIEYRVPMPLPESEYRREFAAGDSEFDELLAGATAKHVVPDPEGPGALAGDVERRAHQRALVGAYAARVAHVFVALWNGKSMDVDTGRIVDFRLRGAPPKYLSRSSVLDAPETGPVYHVVAGRVSDPVTLHAPGSLRILISLDRTIEERNDPLGKLCRSIDAFNRDLERLDLSSLGEGLPIERLRTIASRLAVYFQKQFRRALRMLFVATAFAAITLAVFAHVLDPQLWLVYIYAGATCVAAYAFWLARRGRWQDRLLEYRMLDMGLRVQRMWDLAGLERSVADHYLRRQRSELDWIRDAIRTVHELDRAVRPFAPVDPELAIQAVREFVSAQGGFFAKSAQANEGEDAKFKRVSGAALLLSLVASAVMLVTVSVLVFRKIPIDASAPALSFFGLLARHLNLEDSASHELTRWMRDVPLMATAIFTIAAALFHEYTRRNAYHAQARRYQAMRDLYARAQSVLEESAREPLAERLSVARDIALEVGREALAENVEWGLTYRELPIELLRV